MQKVSLVHGLSLIILCFALLVGLGGGSHNFSTMCFGPCYHVDGGLTSLSTSKDGSQVVVAGRNGETMSKGHFVNFSGTITPLPPLHDSTSPYIPTMWPYHYHGYFDLSSYSATTVSNGAILTKLNIQITREQQYIPRKLALGQSAVCKKNNQLLPAQNLDSDSKCFSRKQNVSPHNVFYLKLITPRRHTCLTQAVILSFTNNLVATIVVFCKNRQP